MDHQYIWNGELSDITSKEIIIEPNTESVTDTNIHVPEKVCDDYLIELYKEKIFLYDKRNRDFKRLKIIKKDLKNGSAGCSKKKSSLLSHIQNENVQMSTLNKNATALQEIKIEETNNFNKRDNEDDNILRDLTNAAINIYIQLQSNNTRNCFSLQGREEPERIIRRNKYFKMSYNLAL
ncbi:hypothetical protein ACFW04_013628 [Cataglyphis niger]